jgi:O-antigen/teichoic acid export membrane protein
MAGMSGKDPRRELPEERPAEGGIRLVARNGTLAAAQVLLTSIGYLFAYRVMSSTVGIAAIGSWSLCLALASLAALADLGAVDGMARAVAQRAAGSLAAEPRRTLWTGLLMCVAGCLAGAVLCYVLGTALLPRVLSDPAALSTTVSLFAPALLVAGLNAMGLVFQATLEGLERYQLRFVAGAAGTGVFLVTVLLLVPTTGLRGVVWSYLAQAVTVAVVAGTFCWRLTRPAASVRAASSPSLALARELIRIGMPVRATGLTTVLLDPLTRVAVTYFGGTVSAGHYEVASRLVLQLRTVIVAGFQAGLPRLVKLAAVGSGKTAEVTAQTYRAGLSIAVAAFTMAVLLAPFVYELVLGAVTPVDLRFFTLLCAGWCVNAVSAPFFFSLVAHRRVAALWASSAAMAVVNVALFGLLGRMFGDVGVVAALALAVAAGSALTIVAARRLDEAVPPWIRAPELVLVATSALACWTVAVPGLRGGYVPSAAATPVLATIAYAAVVLTTLHFSGIFRR